MLCQFDCIRNYNYRLTESLQTICTPLNSIYGDARVTQLYMLDLHLEMHSLENGSKDNPPVQWFQVFIEHLINSNLSYFLCTLFASDC